MWHLSLFSRTRVKNIWCRYPLEVPLWGSVLEKQRWVHGVDLWYGLMCPWDWTQGYDLTLNVQPMSPVHESSPCPPHEPIPAFPVCPLRHFLWVPSTYVWMGNWRKLSQNYHQILFNTWAPLLKYSTFGMNMILTHWCQLFSAYEKFMALHT